MAFKYQKRDAAEWEKRATQQGNDFAGIILDDYKTYTAAKGDNFCRILPPTWEEPKHYGLEVYVHYGIGPDRASVLCLAKMKNARCPICEARARAEKAADEELANELRATKRVLVWMIDRKEEAKGPLIWSMPWTLDRDFCKLARDPRSGEIYMLDDPENGYDISFEKTGEQLQTKYVGIQIARRASSVDQDFVDYVVMCPLPECLHWRDYDEVRDIYSGGAAVAEEPRREEPPARQQDEPERERPAFRTRGGGAAAREEPPPPRGEDDYRGAPPEDERRSPPREEPRREEPRREPEPDRERPPESDPKSKAAELRARFNRK